MEQLDSKSSVCIKLVPRCFVNSAVQCSSVIWCNVTLSVQCTGYTSLFTWSSKNKIFGYYFQQVITWTTVLLHMYSMDPWFSYFWTGHNDVSHSCCVRHNGGKRKRWWQVGGGQTHGEEILLTCDDSLMKGRTSLDMKRESLTISCSLTSWTDRRAAAADGVITMTTMWSLQHK